MGEASKHKRKPVFIHSLFRTGSTYIWNKFRQDGRYCCYYEPFHQLLSEISLQKPSPWAYDPGTTTELRHPGIKKNHFFEYQKCLSPGQEGLPYFKKSFSFDDFCRVNDHPDQKKYIDFLMANAGGKILLLQFNRSSFRIRWFRRYYPGAVHIYLVRNPRDQFQSYISMAEENDLDIFLTMDLLAAGINRDSSDFKALAARVPLLEYHAERFEDEQLIYSHLLPLYSTAEKYYIFYFTWFRAFMENVLKADLLLNIDLLSTSPSYRREIQEKFKTLGIETIDFSDARIGNYETYGLSKRKMTEIEKKVQAFILETYNNNEIERVVNNLDEKNARFFKFDKTTFYLLPGKTNPKIDMDKELLKKYKLHFSHFSGEVIRQHHEIRELKGKLDQKEQQLAQKSRQVEEKDAAVKKILNSKSYRLGRLILSPFIWLKRITKERKNSNE